MNKTLKTILGLGAMVLLIVPLQETSADIVTDGTAGIASTLPGPEFVIPESLGTLRGNNLLHSFSEFNILAGESASFQHTTADVSNILARVTGGTSTMIDGTLSASANLYLLNPSGVVVGSNAQIDVSGALYTSGDDPAPDRALILADGATFSLAADLSTLSLAEPIEFGFLSEVTGNQIEIDDSLTGVGGAIVPIDVDGVNTFTIDGDDPNVGTYAGDNLFFSFTRFNVFSNDRAVFASNRANPVDNIVARVTGGSRSWLNGSVAVEGAATGATGLWFVNPAGILASEDFALDVTGAIGLSTAQSIRFADGDFTVDTTVDALPSGEVLGPALSGGSGELLFSNVDLRTEADDQAFGDVHLSGDLITLQGSNLSSAAEGGADAGSFFIVGGRLFVENTDIESTSDNAGNAGGISINANEIYATDSSELASAVSGDGDSGSVTLVAERIEFADDADIDTTTSGLGAAGAISMEADSILLGAGVDVNSESRGDGVAGDITLAAREITFEDNVDLRSNTRGPGNAGTITVSVDDSFTALGVAFNTDGSLFRNRAHNIESQSRGSGSAGNVVIESGGQIDLNALRVNVIARGSTPADQSPANISVSATDLIRLNDSQLNTRSSTFVDSGDILVTANEIELIDTPVAAFTDNFGNGGTVAIQAGERIEISGVVTDTVPQQLVRILVDSRNAGSGAPGKLVIEAPTVEISDAEFISQTLSERILLDDQGNPRIGTIDIRGTETLEITDSTIVATTLASAPAGSITLQGGDVTISDRREAIIVATGLVLGEGIEASTFSSGDAGDVTIIGDTVQIDSDALIGSDTQGAGDGGLVTIDAGRIVGRTDATITSQASGEGDAGGIVLLADSIDLDDTDVLSSTTGSGEAGKIELFADDIELSDGVDIDSQTFASGNAGTISLRGDIISLRDGVDIISNTRGGGNAGTINIATSELLFASGESFNAVDSLFRRRANNIESQSRGGGNAGKVNITSDGDVDISSVRINVIARTTTGENAEPANIVVAARGDVRLNDSQLNSRTDTVVDSGNITVRAENIILIDTPAQVSTQGDGNGGTLSIEAVDTIVLDGVIDETVPQQLVRLLSTSATGDSGAPGSVRLRARVIDINAAEIIGQTQSNRVVLDDSGNARVGNIRIEGEQVTLSDTAVVATALAGAPAGDITIVGGDINIENAQREAVLVSAGIVLGEGIEASTFAGGDAGTITILADRLDLTESLVSAATSSLGNGGAIRIEGDVVNVTESVVRSASERIAPEGDTGEDMDAAALAELTTGTAGDVEISGGTISFNNAIVSTLTESNLVGEASELAISAANALELSNVQLEASTSGAAAGGNIRVTGPDITVGRNAVLSAETTGLGSGGSIVIEGFSGVTITDGANITVDSRSAGNGGSIFASSGNNLIVEGDRTSLVSNAFAVGNGGRIDLSGFDIILRDGASIESTADAQGNSGTIALQAENNIRLESSSPNGRQTSVLTSSQRSTGGDIQITSGGAVLLDRSALISSVGEAQGNGGDINFNAREMVLRKSVVLAQAVEGNGGAISIQSQNPTQPVQFFTDQESVVNADSQTGVDGEISIQDPDTDVSALIQPQDARLVSETRLSADICAPDTESDRSSFVVRERGGVPQAPDTYLSSGIDSRESGGAVSQRPVTAQQLASVCGRPHMPQQ